MSRLLLDTHTFLWWDSSPNRLSPAVLALCRDPAVILSLSLVSLWEIQIKSNLDKLPLSLPLSDIIKAQQNRHGLQILPITSEHIYALNGLPHHHKDPYHHKDPFDRLLIAQALTEKLPLASADSLFSAYPISVIR